MTEQIKDGFNEVAQLPPPAPNELFAAAYDGKIDAIRDLLERGADIEERNVFNQTPIFGAVRSGCAETVHLLICKGADVDAKTDSKQGYTTALSWARFYRGEGRTGEIEKLLENAPKIRQNFLEREEEERIKRVTSPALHRDLPVRAHPLGVFKRGAQP